MLWIGIHGDMLRYAVRRLDELIQDRRIIACGLADAGGLRLGVHHVSDRAPDLNRHLLCVCAVWRGSDFRHTLDHRDLLQSLDDGPAVVHRASDKRHKVSSFKETPLFASKASHNNTA